MLTVKIGKNETELASKAVQAAVLNFVETKGEIDLLNEKLKGYKATMIDQARDILGDGDTQTLTFCVDDDKVKIGFAFDIKIKDEAALREILGERFDDLVSVKTDYKPDTKLKEMALDDDGLRECMSVKEKAPSVTAVK